MTVLQVVVISSLFATLVAAQNRIRLNPDCYNSMGGAISVVHGNPDSYVVLDSDGSPTAITGNCPDALPVFNTVNCLCEPRFARDRSARKPLFWATFNRNASDQSPNNFASFLIGGAVVDADTGTLRVGKGYLSVPAFNSLDLGSAVSFCSSFKCDIEPCANGAILSNYINDDEYTVVLATQDNNTVSARLNFRPPAEQVLSGTFQNAANGWNHVCLTYDSNAIRLYLNGAVVDKKLQGGSLAVAHAPLDIGRDFKGGIDNVYIAKFALAQQEIDVHRLGTWQKTHFRNSVFCCSDGFANVNYGKTSLRGGYNDIVFQDGANSARWSNGCDIEGSDIASVSGPGESCSGHCWDNPQCTDFVWTNFNGGTCWLKSNAHPVSYHTVPDGSYVCGFLADRSYTDGRVLATRGGFGSSFRPTNVTASKQNQARNAFRNLQWQQDSNGMWASNCDISGHDIGSSLMTTGDSCSTVCYNTVGCTHFVWSTIVHGGTCWLKAGVQNSDVFEIDASIGSICGYLTRMMLYHATSPDIALLIEADHWQLRPGSCRGSGTNTCCVGSANYLADAPEVATNKANNCGAHRPEVPCVVLKFSVNIGNIYEVNGCQCNGDNCITLAYLRTNGYDSVRVNGLSDGREYAVYTTGDDFSRQATFISRDPPRTARSNRFRQIMHIGDIELQSGSSYSYWARGCDITGHDIGSVSAPGTGATCSDLCNANPQCTDFVWSNFNGGTCWLKRNAETADYHRVEDSDYVCGYLAQRTKNHFASYGDSKFRKLEPGNEAASEIASSNTTARAPRPGSFITDRLI